MIYDETQHFQLFIAEMNKALLSNSEEDGRVQRDLMTDLFAEEESFKRTLIKIKGGREMFKLFVHFITKKERNILKARSYFRERQHVFSAEISEAFYTGKHTILYNYSINYNFIRWVMKNYNGSEKNIKRLDKKFKEIIKIRHVMCENNMPLALHKTKLFWSRIPRTRMTYMDMVQATSEGLLTAIDKFAPPYKSNFRNVAIGRMTLNLMTDHNATPLHLSPKDRRVLYRANKARNLGYEKQEMLDYVLEKFNNVTMSDLDALFSAAIQPVDLYSPTTEDADTVLIDIIPDEKTTQDQVENQQMIQLLYGNLDKLSLIERKIIKMKFGI